MLTAAVTSWPCVPLVGLTDSHDASSEAVKFSVPPPVFDTVTVLDAGLPWPTVALNASDVGDTDSVGGVGCEPVEPTA